MGTTTAPSEAVRHATLDEWSAANVARDVERMTACFAPDAMIQPPEGTYRGIDAIRAYLRWFTTRVPSVEYEDRGFGRQLVGDIAVWEGIQRGVDGDGIRFEVPMLAAFEFDEAGKISRMVSGLNQWTLVEQGAEQLSGIKGAIARWFVSVSNSAMRKDLPAS